MDAPDHADEEVLAAQPAPVSTQPQPAAPELQPPAPHSGGIYIYDPATGRTTPAPAEKTIKE